MSFSEKTTQGWYNRTFFAAFWKPNFYHIQQPLAAQVSELWLPESIRGEGPEYKTCHVQQHPPPRGLQHPPTLAIAGVH